jgi:hypothetical protein
MTPMSTRHRVLAVFLGIALTGCNDDPSSVNRTVADIQIMGVSDSIDFDSTWVATATVTNVDGVPLDLPITWSSSDPEILGVASDGTVRGLRPGGAYLRASSGGRTDSLRIGVSLASCRTLGIFGEVGSNFRWAWVLPGSLENAHGTPMQYMETNALYAGGIAVGTTADTTLVAMYPAGGNSDFEGFVCNSPSDGAASHLVAVVQPRSNQPSIPGLRIVQDFFAYDTPSLDDFVITAYTFSNQGGVPISDLTVGYTADFDLYSSTNVASFDPATNAMDVIAPDSITNPIVTGVVFVDDAITSYRSYTLGGMETRQTIYGYMTGGMAGPNRTTPGDVRQVAAIAPFDLQPGETRTVWIAIVGGENRSAFNQHVEQAKAWVALIR